MGTKSLLGIIGVGLGVVACTTDNSGSDFDVPSYHVGDDVDGGKVTQVAEQGDCRVVTVTYDAEWSCNEEQLHIAQGIGPSYVEPSAAPALAEAEQVALRVTDCDGLAELRRPAMKVSQQRAIDNNQRSILQDKCNGKTVTKYYLDGKDVQYCSTPGYPGIGGYPSAGTGGSSFGFPSNAAPGTAGAAPSGAVPTTAEGAKDYSKTNTQVVGVDEADFVKNDAGNVYVLSAKGLHVIDAWPAPETKEVKLITLPGEPRRLFLDGTKLVVYTRLGAQNAQAGAPSAQGCTYGYDCRFSAEPGETLALVFDVTEPANPKELRRYGFSGNYVASRRVGRYVYTVVQDAQQPVSLPGVDLSFKASSAKELDTQVEARRKEADKNVDDAPTSAFLPWVRSLNPSGGVEKDIDSCDNALAAQAAQGTSFVSLVAFDLETLAQPTRALIAGKPGYVYASGEALYLATDGVDGSDSFYGHVQGQQDRSTIHKFGLDGVNTTYHGSAAIPGHVLNQFSMDEQDGVLRVATSSGWVPDPSVSSNLVTLTEKGGALTQLGSLGGIAPSEDIRSVRFDGSRAFVVTFKKTDPLFVFDLSAPAKPTILGELKIPGFSTYMHPLDKDHLLAIGFDADDHGDFAYFDGIQLQIFDVSELSNPKLLHKTIIGTRGSASEALTNHLAFNYFPQKGVLALPMTVCEGGNDGVYGDKLTFSGLMVFDVSLTTGIKERGRMPFVDTDKIGSGNGFACGTWWASSTSDVKRSIFMDDYAIGISDTLYQVAPLSSLSTVMSKLTLQ